MKKTIVAAIDKSVYHSGGTKSGPVEKGSEFVIKKTFLQGRSKNSQHKKPGPITHGQHSLADIVLSSLEVYSAQELDKKFETDMGSLKQLKTAMGKGFSSMEEELAQLPAQFENTILNSATAIEKISEKVKEGLKEVLDPLRKTIHLQASQNSEQQDEIKALKTTLQKHEKKNTQQQSEIKKLQKELDELRTMIKEIVIKKNE